VWSFLDLEGWDVVRTHLYQKTSTSEPINVEGNVINGVNIVDKVNVKKLTDTP